MNAAVDQRTASDCMRCCVAMVLDLDYDDVPDIPRDPDERDLALRALARREGYEIVHVAATGDSELIGGEFSNGMWIASGPTIRGTGHAVVYSGDRLWHDPHASRAGLLSIIAARVFVPTRTS